MVSSAALIALLPAVMAATIRVDVGKTGLVFSPSSVTAQPGDMLQFHYYPKAHSVTQSSFAAPCKPLSGGINSGFVPVASTDAAATTQTFNVMVNDTKPIWFYCAQGTHCEAGMAMVVNQASSGPNTLDAYLAAAKGATTVVGTAVSGGVFQGAASNSTSSSSASGYASSAGYGSSSAYGYGSSTVATSTATSTASVTTGATTSTSSTAVATGNAAAGPVEFGKWAVAAGVVAAGGLFI